MATIVAGLVLVVTPVGIVPGAAAAETAGRAADQVSTAEAEAAVYFYIKPVHASGKCLTVHQASQANNADIRQYDCKGQQNQQFRMRTSGTIGNEIIARNSQRCITVHQSKKANGTPIKQYECLGQLNQRFLANAGLAGGTNILASHTLPLPGKCLNVKAASKANNAAIILWPCSNASNSLFKFVRA